MAEVETGRGGSRARGGENDENQGLGGRMKCNVELETDWPGEIPQQRLSIE